VTDASLRSDVFNYLKEDKDISPKTICAKLGLDYKVYGHSVRTYKCQWKRQYGVKLPNDSLNLTFHRWSGWIYVPKGVDRKGALGLGDGKTVWMATNAKNRMYVFDARSRGLGRLEWFEPLRGTTENAGRVNIFVKKPAHIGKLKQLLANAYVKSNIIFDLNYFDKWVDTARLKGGHAVKDLGVPLPYSKTEFLKDGLGVVVKTGDQSHPSSLEIEFFYPDWAEKNERLLAENKVLVNQNVEFMRQNIELNKRLFGDASNSSESTVKPIPGGLYG
jgi:hypothetical protein